MSGRWAILRAPDGRHYVALMSGDVPVLQCHHAFADAETAGKGIERALVLIGEAAAIPGEAEEMDPRARDMAEAARRAGERERVWGKPATHGDGRKGMR